MYSVSVSPTTGKSTYTAILIPSVVPNNSVANKLRLQLIEKLRYKKINELLNQ